MARFLALCLLLTATPGFGAPVPEGPNPSTGTVHHRVGRVRHRITPGSGEPQQAHRYRAGQNVRLNGNVVTLGYYFLNVTVNNIPLSLLFDTGSSNLAFSAAAASRVLARPVPFGSPLCNACNSVPNGACLFGPPEPGIQEPELCGMSISYGGGSSYIYGTLGLADVELAGLTATNASVVSITRELPVASFSAAPSDGIIGFASETNAVNPSYAPTLWGQLTHTHSIRSAFGLCLNSTNGGVLTLGGYDSSKFSDPLVYLPLTQKRWFNVDLLDVALGQASLDLPSFVYGYKNDAIGTFFDSGTAQLLFGPLAFSTLVDALKKGYANLPGVGTGELFSVGTDVGAGGCISAAKMGSKVADFPTIDLTFRAMSGRWTTSVPGSSYLLFADGQYCLAVSGVPGIGAVLGDVVMENLYIVHDMEAGKLGVAPIRDC